MKLGTHSGEFHADEVYACAILILSSRQRLCDVELVRSRNEDLLREADFLVDIGDTFAWASPDKVIDHHAGNEARKNGIFFASAGKAWFRFGPGAINKVYDILCINPGVKIPGPLPDQLSSEQIAQVLSSVDDILFAAIDARDNQQTVETSTFSGVRCLGVPDLVSINCSKWWERPDDRAMDARFFFELHRAHEAVARVIATEVADLFTAHLCEFGWEYDEPSLSISFDIPAPVGRALKYAPKAVRFGIAPGDGVWIVRAVHKGSLSRRGGFPKGWRGLEGRDLEVVTGVAQARFCHADGHMATALTKEAARKLASIAGGGS